MISHLLNHCLPMLFPNLVPSCPPLTYSGLPEREYYSSRTGLLALPEMSQAHANGLRASARVTLSLDSLMAHVFASLMSLVMHHPFFKNLVLITFYEIATHPTWCPLSFVILFHCTDNF
ncbi:unnamed protein product [Rangifer tarandus platyrhynchus]|uniref:Uncharacterized protein n=2 Tax=Rangifer tarandus platyrhynchus TaxID=3082113 RepID=A0ABN8ZSR1_RANTA|nr:unnamed protein product [Rangifer tarandus platyrhynchus]